MPAKELPPFPHVERVAEETSAREVNILLREGWLLLLVLAVGDAAGAYPCYVLGKPRAVEKTNVPPAKSAAELTAKPF